MPLGLLGRGKKAADFFLLKKAVFRRGMVLVGWRDKDQGPQLWPPELFHTHCLSGTPLNG